MAFSLRGKLEFCLLSKTFCVSQREEIVEPCNPAILACRISFIIIKITISPTVIGFKKLPFSTNSPAKLSDSLLSDSSMSQSHLKLLFKSTNHIQSCSLNQPITTLVSITIETVYRLLNWGFLQNGEFFPLEQ